jgi:hypothetical protein
MKKVHACAMAIAMGTLLTAAIQAQTSSFAVKVPFAFYVGEEKFQAGTYRLSRASDSVLKMRDEKGHSTLLMTNNVTDPKKDRQAGMVFNRYSNDYFLSEVQWGASDATRGLTKSPREVAASKPGAPARVVAPVSKN